MSARFHIVKEFGFEAAHTFAHKPAGHENTRVHGHSFKVEVALTGKLINVPDAYTEAGFDFSGAKNFDKRTGYRSKSFLTLPLKNYEGQVVGVIQLINAKNDPGEVIASGTIFDHEARLHSYGLLAQAAWMDAARHGSLTIQPGNVHKALRQVPAASAKIHKP